MAKAASKESKCLVLLRFDLAVLDRSRETLSTFPDHVI